MTTERTSSTEQAEPAGLNWAGNYRYTAPRLYRPKDVEKLQSIVKKSQSVKGLGSRHSFNDIADSAAVQISTENLNAERSVDPEEMSVTV